MKLFNLILNWLYVYVENLLQEDYEEDLKRNYSREYSLPVNRKFV